MKKMRNNQKKGRPQSIRVCKVSSDTAFCPKKQFVLSDGDYVVFDMGKASVGGYPFFKVKAYTGKPVVRISYSDRMTPYEKEESMPLGDFTRGSCTYLGVELPVMPGNPYRFEQYTITRCGEYTYPLIQGQQRFIYISVSGENASVTFSDFFIYDDSDEDMPVGYFSSDNEKLDKIWQASANTVRLATIRAKQWEIIDKTLLLRKLTKGKSYGVLQGNYDRIESTFLCAISQNPEHVSGVSALLFSKGDDGYRLTISLSGEIKLIDKTDGNVLAEANMAIVDNRYYQMSISADMSGVSLTIDGVKTLLYEGALKTGGSFGFEMDAEWRAALQKVVVKGNGKTVYTQRDGLIPFGVEDTGLFISDGAKRDRLPWTGDLDWAFDGGWYAFGQKMKALNTLKIMAFNSTDEGYIWGTCYPENYQKPAVGEYGYYQSDMFSVWYVLSALVYELYSDDKEVEGLYPVVKGCMDYVWRYVEEDGLFNQRYETSKGLWDHKLGDVGKNTYTNLMIWEGYRQLAAYAKKLGKDADANEFIVRAEQMKGSIFTHLYSEELGGFVKRDDLRELCDLANPFAMGKGLVSAEQASKIAAKYREITHPYGKVAILMMRGLFDYGYPEKAWDLLCGKLPVYIGDAICSYVDWFGAIDHPDYPETVYECMTNPPLNFGVNGNWGDLSHPDSAVSGVISSRIAGVMPLESGFKKILLRPCLQDLQHLRCGVPTKRGMIRVEIEVKDGKNQVRIQAPKGVEILTDFSLMKGETVCKKSYK